MLVVSRRRNEKVLVPQYEIVLEVLEIRGGRVRLGISAPAGVGLYRDEVWDRLAQERGEEERPVEESEPAPAAGTVIRAVRGRKAR